MLHTSRARRAYGLVVATLLWLPYFALAQAPDITWINNFANELLQLVRAAVPVLTALAVLLFIWGVIKYFIYGANDETARATGRTYMVYALIGLVAVVAVWGLVALFLQIVGVGSAPSTSPGYYFPVVS